MTLLDALLKRPGPHEQVPQARGSNVYTAKDSDEVIRRASVESPVCWCDHQAVEHSSMRSSLERTLEHHIGVVCYRASYVSFMNRIDLLCCCTYTVRCGAERVHAHLRFAVHMYLYIQMLNTFTNLHLYII